jgi:hypothetical protein
MALMTVEEFRVLRFVLATLVAKAKILFHDDPAWQGKEGCYFCAGNRLIGTPRFGPVLIGLVPIEKAPRYQRLSAEKEHRLALHPRHLSSYESRDTDVDKWGGAVSLGVREPIFSISGYPEYGDEALSLIVAEIHGARNSLLAVASVAESIALRNENPYWEPLRVAAWNIMATAINVAA